MSRRTIATAALLAAVLSATTALAAEMQGKVQSVDAAARTVTLDDGTKLWLGDGVSADDVKEGTEVKVSYEERDGRNVATSVEVK